MMFRNLSHFVEKLNIKAITASDLSFVSAVVVLLDFPIEFWRFLCPFCCAFAHIRSFSTPSPFSPLLTQALFTSHVRTVRSLSLPLLCVAQKNNIRACCMVGLFSRLFNTHGWVISALWMRWCKREYEPSTVSEWGSKFKNFQSHLIEWSFSH